MLYAFKKQYKHNTCVDVSTADGYVSVKIECNEGDYAADKKFKGSVFIGSKDCTPSQDPAQTITTDFPVDNTCQQAVNPID